MEKAGIVSKFKDLIEKPIKSTDLDKIHELSKIERDETHIWRSIIVIKSNYPLGGKMIYPNE